MASVVFDRLWDDAFKREGELVTDGAILAQVYGISSAIEALRLASGLMAAGQPFFEHCDFVQKSQQTRVLERLRRQGRLSTYQVKFIKEFLAKTAKGW